MCGIAGMVGEVDEALLRRMLEAMRYRGPDDLGLFVDDRAAIGQTRLSIIDVVGGHQPILNEDGNVAIVANGEIYNYRSLARDPMGIKPLYYAIEDGTFYFASEMKALLTASKRVCEFPNGHWYRSDGGFQRFASW